MKNKMLLGLLQDSFFLPCWKWSTLSPFSVQELSRILKVSLRKRGGNPPHTGPPQRFCLRLAAEPPASVDCDPGFLPGVHVHFCSGASEPTCLSLRPRARSWPSDLPHFSDDSNRAIIEITDFRYSFSLVRMATSKPFTC